jgi:sulfotransferase family protein
MTPLGHNKQTSKRPRSPTNGAAKFLRRLRRVSARQITDRFPAVTKQLQRIRYRNWARETSNVGHAGAADPLRPDFLIVGAPKCGTSWLMGGLGQHPNVIMLPEEIEYFSLHLDYPLEWYAEHFARQRDAAKHAKRAPYLLGEKSARYCAMPIENIEHARKVLPDAKLILMTRDPVSRHWAHAKKFFAKRKLINPDQAVLSMNRRKLLEFFEAMRPLGEFSKIIDNWTSVYPKDRLLVLSQEKALTSPQAILDAVREHLGLAADFEPDSLAFMTRQRNRGPNVEMPQDVAEFLEGMFADERQWLRDFFRDRPFVHLS